MKIAIPALVAGLMLASAAHAAPPDRMFLTDAMKGDNSEVALGKLAQQRGHSPAVRAYGSMLVRDHGAHRQTLATLGRKIRVSGSTAMTPDAMRAHRMLVGLRGAAFDRAVKRHMVEDHQKDIATYRMEARGAQNASVRAMASATVPTLETHLRHAQRL
jgi:putative membrane protein